jgi:hypothetical protein
MNINGARNAMDNEATVSLPDGTTHLISELSDEVKEILALWQSAQKDMLEARKTAIINELAVNSLAEMVKEKLAPQEQETEDVENS